jgi:TonB-dependent SusC/RagA subfamily outer membrane receptor
MHQVQVSVPGFETKILVVTLRAGGAGLLEFSLLEDPVAMEELVVAGSEPERKAGNAVATVDGAIFEVTAANDISAVLRDLVGGVHGISSSGQVGTGTSIRIRGPTSVTQRDAPLVYLDGILLPTRRAPGAPGTGQSVGALDMISADDIARIQILRGAAATARYGMNASSGVILIYTKRGSRPN